VLLDAVHRESCALKGGCVLLGRLSITDADDPREQPLEVSWQYLGAGEDWSHLSGTSYSWRSATIGSTRIARRAGI
jgi:hypothetical protein